MASTLSSLEKEVTCDICQEHYAEPKVLPCFHYYCKTCIIKLSLITNKLFYCPECQRKIKVENADDLPSAHFIHQKEQLLAKQKKAMCKEMSCEICTEADAKGFCKQCKKFICEDCIKSHQRMKAIFEGHQIASMLELQHLPMEDVIQSPASLCASHKKQLDVFCFQCDLLICRDCLIVTHREHQIEFKEKVAASNRKKLEKDIQDLKQIKHNVSDAIKEVQLTTRDIEVQGNDLEKNINESFEKLKKLLSLRQAQLIQEVEAKVQKKTSHLRGQEKSLYTTEQEIQNAINYTQQCVKYCSDNEMTLLFDTIQSLVNKEKVDPRRNESNMKPVEEVDMKADVDCSDEFQEFCRNNLKVTHTPVAILMHNELEEAQTYVTQTVTISLTLADGKQLKSDPTVESQLMQWNGYKIQNHVERISLGEYAISFTPTASGKNELLVSVQTRDGSKSECSFTFGVLRGRGRSAKVARPAKAIKCKAKNQVHV